MEMVKYLAMAAALVGSVAIADLAQARGRHGCATCGAVAYGGGCPGGVCSAPVAPAKMAMADGAVPAVEGAPSAAPVATQPAPRTYVNNTARRGLFGWRR